jgi:DNA-directed RNA polymerase subunit M/transcription elongation factor TFIIS
MKDDLQGTRLKARGYLCTALNETLGERLETLIFNWTLSKFKPCLRYWENPEVRKQYTEKVLQLKSNICNTANPHLKRRIVDGSVSLRQLVEMHPYDMFPERWEDIFLQVARKRIKKELTEDVATMPDGLFTCGACKSKKTSFTQLQTRSADEGLTTYVQCHNCKKNWKMG